MQVELEGRLFREVHGFGLVLTGRFASRGDQRGLKRWPDPFHLDLGQESKFSAISGGEKAIG